MSPEDIWKSFLELKADRMIPMHYATFDLSDEPAGEPLKRLQSVANSTDLLIPAIGKTNWI
jgi:L-ascorbate metabolism protein UlaG (beta-lactamase superfamily)